VFTAGVVSVSTVISVANALYTTVPDFKKAADCFAQGPSIAKAGCIPEAFLSLYLNLQERQTVESILQSAGVQITIKSIASALLRVSVNLIQQIGTLGAMYFDTSKLGHTAVEIMLLTA
jgi:hypothetical protein